MKRSKLSTTVRHIITLSFYFLVFTFPTFACGPAYFSAADNRIYRILPPLWQAPEDPAEMSFATRNILLWSKQTGCRDTAAIRNAIYQGSLADWETLYKKYVLAQQVDVDRHNKAFFGNSFVKRLQGSHPDKEGIRILYWSKLYESIRNAQRSPWYYNSHVETDEVRQLRTMYKALQRYKPSPKYADRYTLLTSKCLWALGEDSANVALWDQCKQRLKKDIFYDEVMEYVSRSLSDMGCDDEAYALYRSTLKEIDKIPFNASLSERLRAMLRICPNSYNIAILLQEYLTDLDRDLASAYRFNEDETKPMLAVAREALANPKVRNKAMWRYVAACTHDYEGHPDRALAMLRGAEQGGGDAFLRQSVRVLTFYLRARSASIDDAFEQYAIGEVKWMDSEALREWRQLPDDIRQDISHVASWGTTNVLNKLYFYAALRRIMLEDSVGLVWRLAAAGRDVRALQMANVADNHIMIFSRNSTLEKVRYTNDSVYRVWYTGNDQKYHGRWISSLSDTLALDGHHYYFDAVRCNCHDYSNGLFAVADRMSAGALAEYCRRLEHPLDRTDRWFNTRSYTNGDYWQDIVGTHYLRERKYAAAVKHLRRISPSYQQRMNVWFDIDPFSIDHSVANHDTTHYKLRFAQKMDSLQRVMLHDSDADRRGLAMLEYTIGLDNSFNMCWMTTSYQKGWTGANLTDIDETVYAEKAQSVVKQLRKKAFATLRSDDAKARAYARIGHYSKIWKRYAHTPTGQHLALVCDRMDLYQSPVAKAETSIQQPAEDCTLTAPQAYPLLQHYLLPTAYERYRAKEGVRTCHRSTTRSASYWRVE